MRKSFILVLLFSLGVAYYIKDYKGALLIFGAYALIIFIFKLMINKN